MFERAIEIEPQFADAHAGLGLTYYESYARHWSQDPNLLERALELGKKAITLDDTIPSAYSLLSHVYLWKRLHDQAITIIKKKIALDPNDAYGYADLAETLVWAGKPSEALGLVKKAMRLNPHYPVNYLFTLGFANYGMERYEEAETALKSTLTRSPDHLGAQLVLATIYSEKGRLEEARKHVAEAMRINPQLSLEDLRRRLPALPENGLDALRKAGLPD
jgi:tetratricopeptide (TPR) repeat protein